MKPGAYVAIDPAVQVSIPAWNFIPAWNEWQFLAECLSCGYFADGGCSDKITREFEHAIYCPQCSGSLFFIWERS